MTYYIVGQGQQMNRPIFYLLFTLPLSVSAAQLPNTGLDNVSKELAITMLRAEQRECGVTPTEERLMETLDSESYQFFRSTISMMPFAQGTLLSTISDTVSCDSHTQWMKNFRKATGS